MAGQKTKQNYCQSCRYCISDYKSIGSEFFPVIKRAERPHVM